MQQRQLFLAAYDIASPRRLRRALYILRDYATGGQKSVFECFLSKAERRELLARVDAVIDPEDDRFFLLRLDPRAKTGVLGIAIQPADPAWFYVG